MTDNRVLSSLSNSTAAGKNLVINGAMDIWQRGTSFASSNSTYVFTADRWEIVRHGYLLGMTVSRQLSGLDGFKYCARIQRDSGNTSTNNLQFQTSFESSELIPFINKPIVISFYARKSSTASSGSLTSQIIAGTGTDQAMKNYTGGTVAFQQSFTVTDSWQRFTYNGTVSSTYSEFGIWFGYYPSGTAGAADYIEITGVQIELGNVPTVFSRSAGNIQGELAACQRYYIRWKSEDSSANNPTMPIGQMINTTTFRSVLQFPTAMRIKPSAIEYSGFRLLSGSSGYTVTNIVLSQGSALQQELQATITSGPAAATAAQLIPGSGSTTDYIGLSAEL